MYEQAGCPLFLLCCFRLGKILHGNAFSGVCFDASPLRYLGYFHIPDKAIVDYDSLRSVFTFALCFKNINVVDEFTEQWCGKFVHSHKSADCRSEVLAFLFALSAFGKLLTESFYLGFQLQPFYPNVVPAPAFQRRCFALVVTNYVSLIFVQSTKSTLTPLTPTVLAKSYPIQPIIQL